MNDLDAPRSTDDDDLLAAFDIDGTLDRTVVRWVALAVGCAVVLMSIVWMSGPAEASVVGATIAVALLIVGIMGHFVHPRIARIEVRRSGIRVWFPQGDPPTLRLEWSRLRATEMASIAQTGPLDVRVVMAMPAPSLRLKLAAADAHALLAAVHEGHARFGHGARFDGVDRSASGPVPPAVLPCLRCDYDRTGLDDVAPCPECGAAPSRVDHVAMAWSAGPARRLRWFAAVFAVAAPMVIMALVHWGMPFPDGMLGCWIVILPVVGTLIVARVLDLRPIDGPPTIAVLTHARGVTIRRAGAAPLTLVWADFLRIRAGRTRSGPYRTIHIAGLAIRAGMRQHLELPHPEVDRLAAAIHRGLSANAARRRGAPRPNAAADAPASETTPRTPRGDT